MRIKDALRWGQEILAFASSSNRLDAEILLAHALGKPNTFLLAHDDTEVGFSELKAFKNFIEKRQKGIPVAYLTGVKEFYFLDFEVTPDVLVPRPDTEILVEEVIVYLKGHRTQDTGHSRLLVDVGTGSGCIPISILKNVPGLSAVATDISSKALNIARRNAKKHGVADRIEFTESDLLGGLSAGRLAGHEVVLTANLPYIPVDFEVNPDLKHEPQIALYSGMDGLDLYRLLMPQIQKIRPRAVFLEMFDFQIPALTAMAGDYEVTRIVPMTGKARLVILGLDPGI